MSNMRTRMTAAASLSIVAGLGLAGCGGTGASESGSQSDAAPDGGTTEITVMHYWDGANADTFDAMVDEYNASHPEVRVTTSNVPNADFMTKLRASATSDSLPDVAIGDLVWVPQIAQMGSLADLSGRLPAATLSDINPALRDYGSIDGRQVSVPVSANNLAYMYNRTLFQEAGLDPDDPPQTWDDLLADGKTILERTGKPGYDLYTEAGDTGEGLTWNFQVNLWQAGGEFLTPDNSAAAFNTDEGRKALQFWVDLIQSGVSPYASWGEFEKGSGGSAMEGSWMVGIWAADPPFDFDVATLPRPADGVQATNLGGEQAMVFENSDEKVAAAADFLSWLLEPEQVVSWSETVGMLPVLDSVADSDEYRSWVEDSEPRLLPYVEQMAFARTRPNTPLYPKISLAFAQQIEKAFSGEASVEDALASAETAVNDVIENG
ncbi:ABC transporter substrate-binding protein [Schaalia naturae]|uniref:ABC transporter substrate-binding protein n=1 Tax=Schaalia naturae TaxID=635203 RepID=A0ABW2SNC9_9ACTO